MIRIKDVAYVRYGAPDLDTMEQFLTDFGMCTAIRTEDRLYMRGYGTEPFIHITELTPEPKVIGLGLTAKSKADLEQIAAKLSASVIENPEPAGGYLVQLIDPQGLQLDIIYGRESAEPLPVRAPLVLNNGKEKQRFGNTQRLEAGPAHIMRLGHVALMVPDLEASMSYYRNNFGFEISDGYHDGNPANEIAYFLHCGLGDEYTDHHTIAMMGGGTGIEHCGFEALDWDDVMSGHHLMESKNYQHSWGIGRHILGSQVFDYWRDPFANKLEFWTDGDLVNDDYKPTFIKLEPAALHQWAAEINPNFFD